MTLVLSTDANRLNMLITNSQPDILPLDNNVSYFVKTDGRGCVSIKSKKLGDRTWSCPHKLNVDGNAGNLLENGAHVMKTPEGYMLGYAPTQEELRSESEYPVYTIDDYNKMANDAAKFNNSYKESPKFVEGYQNGDKAVFYEYTPTDREKKLAEKDDKDNLKGKMKDDDDSTVEDESECGDKEDSDQNGIFNISPSNLSVCYFLIVETFLHF